MNRFSATESTSDWETWVEHVTVGDKVSNIETGTIGTVACLDLDGSECFMVERADGSIEFWPIVDCVSPDPSEFELWAADQGEGE